jgi:hypothetical protein
MHCVENLFCVVLGARVHQFQEAKGPETESITHSLTITKMPELQGPLWGNMGPANTNQSEIGPDIHGKQHFLCSFDAGNKIWILP